MAAGKNKILSRMLERLFAGLANGPNLNCRPHSSRQRIDLTRLAKLQDQAPEQILEQLLAGERVRVAARAARPEPARQPDDKSSAAGKAHPSSPTETEKQAAAKE